jgi:hypothetical protein
MNETLHIKGVRPLTVKVFQGFLGYNIFSSRHAHGWSTCMEQKIPKPLLNYMVVSKAGRIQQL